MIGDISAGRSAWLVVGLRFRFVQRKKTISCFSVTHRNLFQARETWQTFLKVVMLQLAAPLRWFSVLLSDSQLLFFSSTCRLLFSFTSELRIMSLFNGGLHPCSRGNLPKPSPPNWHLDAGAPTADHSIYSINQCSQSKENPISGKKESGFYSDWGSFLFSSDQGRQTRAVWHSGRWNKAPG